MSFSLARRAAVAVAIISIAGCTVHNTGTPATSGPSALALTLTVNAIPDSISQDGGSQASIRVLAIGPDGKPVSALPMRVDMNVNGVPQDFGTLSARTIVTNADGVATVVYTAPSSSPNGVYGTCNGLPGTCVSIVATATATNFDTANPQSVLIRLVPPGVILPPPDTPTPTFQFSPTTVGPNQPVTFDATASCGGPVSSSGACQSSSVLTYSWNFGDGSTASGVVVQHSFSNVAKFTVTLTVTNDRGLSASKPLDVTVTASALPTANFTTSPASIQVLDTVFFNATSSFVPAGRTIRSYDWDFGDGTPHGSGVMTTHAYAVVNSYTVTLTVTDDIGQQGVKSNPVSVGTGAPVASFTSSVSNPATHTMTFDGSGSVAVGAATISSYQWAFGDGQAFGPSSSSAATHAYVAAGTFVVRLTVTDSLGRTGTSSVSVIVP